VIVHTRKLKKEVQVIPRMVKDNQHDTGDLSLSIRSVDLTRLASNGVHRRQGSRMKNAWRNGSSPGGCVGASSGGLVRILSKKKRETFIILQESRRM